MSEATILADWGNSSGRLYCVSGHGPAPEILAEMRVPGALETQDFATAFSQATAVWRKTWHISNAWFTGAVTSNLGWIETGYASAPAQAEDHEITSHHLGTGLTGHFLQGVSVATNSAGHFDTMRSEDIQVYGWAALTGQETAWLCLPGTHTKWVRLEDGRITDIATGLTGETLDVLTKHSCLARGAGQTRFDDEAFAKGLSVMTAKPRPALTHMLMTVRTAQIAGEMSADGARDYLCGLLIGEDCAARSESLTGQTVHLIGDGPATDRYSHALERLGLQTERHDGAACSIAGLQHVRALSSA